MAKVYFSAVKEILCAFCNNSAQDYKRNTVWNSHEAVENIRNCENCIYGEERSDCNSQDKEPSENQNRSHFSFCQVFKTFFAVIIPSENGCESKEHETQHKEELKTLTVSSEVSCKSG